MEQFFTPKQEYKVLVRCFTYNQAKYIEDALNGFSIQQTDFPFVCLVMDDCSTDGEQDVIKAWMERECDMSKAEFFDLDMSNVILVPHKKNSCCSFAFYLLKRNLNKEKDKKVSLVTPWRKHCEYEAMCEGDDYWINAHKLQKQVDTLDMDHNNLMCYSKCRYMYQEEGKRVEKKAFGEETTDFQSIIAFNGIPTLTTLFRIDARIRYQNEITPENRNWKMGDIPFWLWCSQNGNIIFLKEVTGVYRVLSNSASHGGFVAKESFIKSTYDVTVFFCKKYNFDTKNEEQRMFQRLYNNAVRFGEKAKENEYYSLIKEPSLKTRIKHIIFNNRVLADLFLSKIIIKY